MDEMRYYLRFREDAYVRSRLEDTVLWSCQCHNTRDGEFGYGKTGWMSERFCHSEGLLTETWPDGSPASTWFALMPWACGSILEGLAGETWQDDRAVIHVYTRPVSAENYPEGLARSIHLAFEAEDTGMVPFNKNYGILFAEGRISDRNTIVPAGVRMIATPMIVLVLAWTLSSICNGLLGIDAYIADAVRRGADAGVLPLGLLPPALFLIAATIAFSTGTSWGTFGILIPIAVSVCAKVDPSLNALVLSAVLSGSVMGDHCSPISDTTILSSTGAQCRHIDHVRTQLPYALTAGAVSAVGYVVAGATRSLPYAASAAITLAVSLALLAAALVALPRVRRR